MREQSVGAARFSEAAFQARLRARDGVRPQSTLAILAGYEPGRGSACAGQAVRQTVRPVPLRARQSLTGQSGATGLSPIRVPVPVAVGTLSAEAARSPAPGLAEPVRRGAGFRRLLFSGLAAVGLAGLAVLMLSSLSRERGAAGPDMSGGETGDLSNEAFSPMAASAVSALAMQAASGPAGQGSSAWFDYRGVADYLRERAELHEAGLREAARIAQAEAERLAPLTRSGSEPSALPLAGSGAEAGEMASALADERASQLAREEAERLAMEEAARAERAEAAIQASQVEAARLARLEAERVAALQQAEVRIAGLEQARAAEAAARLAAEEEARRLAAEAEALRLAKAEAERAARLAEDRLLLEIRARREAEAEVRRLAALEARRLAEIDEMRQAAAREARRIADAEAARLAAAPPAAEAPLVLAAANLAPASPVATRSGPPSPVAKPAPVLPGAASRKPAFAGGPMDGVPVQAASMLALAVPAEPSGTYGFEGAAGFIAGRASLSAAGGLDTGTRAQLEAGFLDLLAAGVDGRDYVLVMPGGLDVKVRFVQTRIVDPAVAEVRDIGPRPGGLLPVARPYQASPAINISVMCRDVSYELPGFERGRFAACQGEGGRWLLAKPSRPEEASA